MPLVTAVLDLVKALALSGSTMSSAVGQRRDCSTVLLVDLEFMIAVTVKMLELLAQHVKNIV